MTGLELNKTNLNGSIEINVPPIELEFGATDYLKMKEQLLEKGGIYRFYYGDDLMYCGQTGNLFRRMNEHWSTSRFNKYSLSEFEKFKMNLKEDIVCKIFFEDDFTYRDIYESWIIRVEKPVFNVLKSEKVYTSYRKGLLDEDLIIAYDKLYKHDLSLDYIDRENVICEKNAVILSRIYLLSQMTANGVVKAVRKYVDRKDFDVMWKLYKEVALKHKLRPIVRNGHLIYNPLKKLMKVMDGEFILEG